MKVKKLREILASCNDDYEIEVRVARELTEKELETMDYKYPYEYKEAEIEYDIGHSDKVIIFDVLEKE